MPPPKIYFILFFVLIFLYYAVNFSLKQNNEENILKKKVFENREIEEIFEKRKIIYDRACKALPLIEEYLKNGSSFENLLELHEQIHNVDLPLPNIPEIDCQTNVIPRSSVFNASETMDLLICLPPKCGTSNWQKALDVHYLNITQGRQAAQELQEKIRNESAHGLVYGVIQRVKTQKLSRAIENGENPRNIYNSKYKIANVRNPFARVFSAWHDKMRNGTDHLAQYGKYFGAIEVFEDNEKIPEFFFFSFEAFVEYIASNPENYGMNGHWGTLFRQCSACALDFSLITHLENSKEEIPFLFEKTNLPINVGGQYTWNGTQRIMEETPRPPDELHWKNVPKETAKLIYKHYFLDFIVFGYSTEEVLKYVESSNSTKMRPTREKIMTSRKYLQNLGNKEDRKSTDFICTKNFFT